MFQTRNNAVSLGKLHDLPEVTQGRRPLTSINVTGISNPAQGCIVQMQGNWHRVVAKGTGSESERPGYESGPATSRSCEFEQSYLMFLSFTVFTIRKDSNTDLAGL